MREMILRAIRGNAGTWETQTESGESHSIREAEIDGRSLSPFSCSFLFLPSFSCHLWIFCLHVHRVEGKRTKIEMAAGRRRGRSR